MNIRKLIFSILLTLSTPVMMFSQGLNKPQIVIVPDQDWMESNHFLVSVEENGSMKYYPDYLKALRESFECKSVLDKIAQLYIDRGYQTIDIAETLNSIETEEAEDMLLTSKDGDGLAENPLDVLERRLKADIWIKVTWQINKLGPQKSVSFTMKAVDSYTKKQIAIATGTGGMMMTPEIPALLADAIVGHIDNFNGQLQKYFDDIIANGRNVRLTIKRFSNADFDLEKEFAGNSLMDNIEDWVSSNSVNGRYSLVSSSQDKMVFTDIRIPLFDTTGKALDTQRWARGLDKYIKDQYGIKSKRMMKGIGECQLVLGVI
jgi:hypothetical protein